MIPESLAPLANHLWQSTLFAGVAGLLTLALRKNPARVRHWVWVTASLKFLVPFSVLISLGSHAPRVATEAETTANLSIALDQVSQPFTARDMSESLLNTLPTAPSALPAIFWTVWAFGFVGLATAWWVRWWRIRATVRAGSPIELGLPIRTISSPSFREPGIFGVFRPVLLLPEDIFEHLTQEQWKTVAAHELCHVRYRDNLIGVAQMFVEAVFWFHPVVWWIGKRILQERERACDEEVLRLGNEPGVYARGILKVCELYLESPIECVAGISGSDLRNRIEGIMLNRFVLKLNGRKKVLIASSATLAVAAPLVLGLINAPLIRAQSQPPAFEVATIKPNVTGDRARRVGRPMTGRLSISNLTVKDIVAYVYQVRDFQISGGPDWVNSSHYDIEAKAEGNPSQDQLKRMLQTLLQDRFKLALHHDSKEFPIYELSVAKGGLKLQPLKEGDCIVFDPEHPPTAGKKSSDFCNNLSNGRGTFDATSATMAEVAMMFSYQVGRIVVNKTGIEGRFPVHLKFAPIEAETGSLPAADGPSIFTAVQEQLGLRLDAAKGPVDVLVIDHVDRPSEN